MLLKSGSSVELTLTSKQFKIIVTIFIVFILITIFAIVRPFVTNSCSYQLRDANMEINKLSKMVLELSQTNEYYRIRLETYDDLLGVVKKAKGKYGVGGP
jgi:hypothetical protein